MIPKNWVSALPTGDNKVVTLQPHKDAALIFRPGEMELIIPNQQGGEEVMETTYAAVVASNLFEDANKDLFQELCRRLKAEIDKKADGSTPDKETDEALS